MYGRFLFTFLDKGDSPITTRKTPGRPDPSALKDKLVAALDANKAEDVLIIPLAGKSALADYMIIASGRSAKHVTSLAKIAGDAAAEMGISSRFEGQLNGDWVLTDVGDIILHIFRPEVRSFYNIEKIWCDRLDELPPVVDLSDHDMARQTGIVA